MRLGLAIVCAAYCLVASDASAQRASPRIGAVLLEDSHSSFTTSTPGPYVRFFARNRDSHSHTIRVVSLLALPPGSGPVPLRLDHVEASPAARIREFAVNLAPRAEPLVVIWFDDVGGVCTAMRMGAAYRVEIEVDGVVRTLEISVPHAIRERWPR